MITDAELTAHMIANYEAAKAMHLAELRIINEQLEKLKNENT